MGTQLNFKIISLNVRGLRSLKKRVKQYSSGWKNKSRTLYFFKKRTVRLRMRIFWRTQWKGKLFFSHGSNHSKGTMILIREGLDFNPKSVDSDCGGRFLLLEATIQDCPFLIINIYAPNKAHEQKNLFFFKLNAK